MSVVVCGTAVSWIAAGGLLLWLIGRIVSDRYLWSQFLLWVPTPVAIGLAVTGLLAALRPGRSDSQRRRRRIRWTTALAALMIYFGFIEHRLMRLPPAEHEGLHIVHWNTWPDEREPTDNFLDGVVALNPDIIILSNAWIIPWWQQTRGWVKQHEATVRSLRPFAVISRVPLISARHIVSKDDIVVVRLEFDTIEQFGHTLTVYAVDLPSDLKRVRMDVASTARRLLDEVESMQQGDTDDAPAPSRTHPWTSPDLAIGDFNITRNSAAMQRLFPEMRHAFSDAGHGYGSTFFRIFPLYHIDHTLLGDTVTATRYDILDPGASRHRAQSVRITPRDQRRR